MSLLPLFDDLIPHRLHDQQFGLALTPHDLLIAAVPPFLSKEYSRPWRRLLAQRDLGSTIKADKEKMQINLDVQHFLPEELTVKIADGFIIIEGKHDEKQDEHGHITRQFSRRYTLPQDCKPESVESSLSSDGVLTVVAPRTSQQVKQERSVPVALTGPVRKEVKASTTDPVNDPTPEQ